MRSGTLYFIILSACFVFWGCKTKEKSVHLIVYKSYYIPKEGGMFFRPLLMKSVGDSLLTFTDNTSTKIYKFNIKNSSLGYSEIFFKPFHTYITQYEFINDSTIIISFNEADLVAEHDSIVLLYNLKSHSKIPFKFDSLKVVLKENDIKYPRCDYLYPMYCNFIFGPDSSLIVTGSRPGSLMDGKFKVFKLFLSGSANTSQSLTLPIYTDSIKNSGFHYSYNELKIRGCKTFQNQIVFSYGMSNDLYLTDPNFSYLKNLNNHPHTMERSKGDTIKPKEYRDLFKIEYEDMFYHPKIKKYFRIVRYPSRKENLSSISYPAYGLLLMNNNFESEGLFDVPYGIRTPIIPFKNGFLGFDQIESDKIDSFCNKYFEFGKEQIQSQNSRLTNNVKISSWNDYFEILDDKLMAFEKVLIIPIENTCTSCIATLPELLKSFDKNNFAVILISSSHSNIKAFRKKYPVPSDKLFIDNQGLYKNLGVDIFNLSSVQKINADSYVWKKYNISNIDILMNDFGITN